MKHIASVIFQILPIRAHEYLRPLIISVAGLPAPNKNIKCWKSRSNLFCTWITCWSWYNSIQLHWYGRINQSHTLSSNSQGNMFQHLVQWAFIQHSVKLLFWAVSIKKTSVKQIFWVVSLRLAEPAEDEGGKVVELLLLKHRGCQHRLVGDPLLRTHLKNLLFQLKS